jgi:hypothetical protein
MSFASAGAFDRIPRHKAINQLYIPGDFFVTFSAAAAK